MDVLGNDCSYKLSKISLCFQSPQKVKNFDQNFFYAALERRKNVTEATEEPYKSEGQKFIQQPTSVISYNPISCHCSLSILPKIIRRPEVF